jgi:hypothetical protein
VVLALKEGVCLYMEAAVALEGPQAVPEWVVGIQAAVFSAILRETAWGEELPGMQAPEVVMGDPAATVLPVLPRPFTLVPAGDPAAAPRAGTGGTEETEAGQEAAGAAAAVLKL